MTAWVSVGLTIARVALTLLAGRALLRAFTLPRGRLRRRQLAVGAVGLLCAVVA